MLRTFLRIRAQRRSACFQGKQTAFQACEAILLRLFPRQARPALRRVAQAPGHSAPLLMREGESLSSPHPLLQETGTRQAPRMPEVPDLVTDNSLRNDLKQTEERRISYKRRPRDDNALDCDGVIEFIVKKKPGPRLLIVNAVHTAAVIA